MFMSWINMGSYSATGSPYKAFTPFQTVDHFINDEAVQYKNKETVLH